MAMSRKINFIFQVSESCLIIQNLILKEKTNLKMGLVSPDGKSYAIYISS